MVLAEVVKKSVASFIVQKVGMFCTYGVGMTARLKRQEDSTKQGLARERKVCFEMNSVGDSKEIANWMNSRVAIEKRNHREDLHEFEDAMIEKAREDDYSLDVPIMCGWSFEIDDDIVSCYKRIEGDSKSCVEDEDDGALLSSKQDDVLKCLHENATWKDNTFAVEFVLNDGALLAEDTSLKMEQVMKNLGWRQREMNSEKLLKCVGMAEYIHITIFERNGVLYISDILQNYIFDP